MVALYLTSVEAAGKTALCAGIGKKLLNDGRKVGFLAPVRLSESAAVNGYKDTLFIKDVLGLEEPIDLLSPVHISRRDLWQSITEEAEDVKQKIKEAYAHISRNKDVVVIEGFSELGVDAVLTQACYKIVEMLDAKVIILLRYSLALSATEIAKISQGLGARLLGVVINYVPRSKIEAVPENMRALFQKEGITVLGVLPEERTLLGVSVGELVETLGGEILTCPENAGEIVENIMLAAMTVDPGPEYFNRKPNKAVVVRGERADMQLAALATSTKCLILSGNTKPMPAILCQAEDKGVPIIMVKQDTISTVTGITEALSRARFRSSQKLHRFNEILAQYFDFKTLYKQLGL